MGNELIQMFFTADNAVYLAAIVIIIAGIGPLLGVFFKNGNAARAAILATVVRLVASIAGIWLLVRGTEIAASPVWLAVMAGASAAATFSFNKRLENTAASAEIAASPSSYYNVNHRVQIGDHHGVVARITSQNTVLQLNGVQTTIPNSQVLGGVIINHSIVDGDVHWFKIMIDPADGFDRNATLAALIDAVGNVGGQQEAPYAFWSAEDTGDSEDVEVRIVVADALTHRQKMNLRSSCIVAAKTAVEALGHGLGTTTGLAGEIGVKNE